jgi:hypothetical protein
MAGGHLLQKELTNKVREKDDHGKRVPSIELHTGSPNGYSE